MVASFLNVGNEALWRFVSATVSEVNDFAVLSTTLFSFNVCGSVFHPASASCGSRISVIFLFYCVMIALKK